MNEAQKQLQLHPYLLAIGQALSLAPDGSEEEKCLIEAWTLAGERYGFDVVTRIELLAEIITLPKPEFPA